MFTEKQANALILAEQLVLMNKDASFVRDYSEAVDKVKALLKSGAKDKANLLSERTRFTQIVDQARNSNNLSALQEALTNYRVVRVDYIDKGGIVTTRLLEPFAVLSTENWLLVAWCRLREDFRFFRLDRIQAMQILSEGFEPHRLTLQEYFDQYH